MSIRFEMQQAATPGQLRIPEFDIGLVGEPVDDRGRATVDYLRGIGMQVHTVSYDQDENELSINGGIATPRSLEDLLGEKRALLEATTLGFAEMFVSMRSLWDRPATTIALMYAEPDEYLQPSARKPLTRRSFELSNEVAYFTGLPRATLLLERGRPTRSVLFAGYEGQRLQQLLEQLPIQVTESELVFGVPAFQPGWEMNTFANTLPIIAEHGFANRFKFAGAQNPAAAYSVLAEIRANHPSARLLVVPVGTKPHGIGAAVFACEQGDVGLVYDFPARRGGRSSRIANWHYFEVQRQNMVSHG